MASILKHPDFELILAAAKRAARSLSRNVLDAECFAMGARFVSEHGGASSQLKAGLDVLAPQFANLAHRLDEAVPGSGDSPLPAMQLDTFVRSGLSAVDGEKVEGVLQFVRRCIRRTLGASALGERGDGPELAELPLIQLAQSIAADLETDTIGWNILACACLAAAEKGILSERPALMRHIEEHLAALSRVMRQQKAEHPVKTATLGIRVRLLLDDAILDEVAASTDMNRTLVLGAVRAAELLENSYWAAFHEAGHAIALALLRPDIRITGLSVVPSAKSLGVVSIDYLHCTRGDTKSLDMIYRHAMCLMAGRAAEKYKFGFRGVNSGAESDIEQATSMLWDAIAQSGLSTLLGPVSLKVLQNGRLAAGGKLADLAEHALHATLRSCEDDSVDFVKRAWPLISSLAHTLFEKKKMTEDEVFGVLSSHELQLPKYVCRIGEAGSQAQGYPSNDVTWRAA